MKQFDKEVQPLVDFACSVCMAKVPNCVNCAWREFDNDYCPEIYSEAERIRRSNNVQAD